MKYFEKCKCSKGKIFASFSLFACFRRPQALLIAVMVIGALFFASCGNADELTPPPPSPKLIITPKSKSVLQGTSVKFTATTIVGSKDEDVTGAASWTIAKPDGSSSTINYGNLTVAKGETAETLTVTAAYDDMSAPVTFKVVATPDKNISPTTSIKEKFGISTTGTKEAVTETFNALHEFIQAGGLTNDKTKDMIVLGDWIDLEAGLTVSRYHRGAYPAKDTSNVETDEANGKISLAYSSAANPQLLRLIVVGINSFHSGRGMTADPTPQATTNGGEAAGQYNVKVNDATQHLVFQFANIPGFHRINPTADGSTGGYEASEMREYLVPVIKENTEVPESGHFLAGLVTAGVPQNVLWGPTRYVATVGKDNKLEDCAPLNDLLWLPTRFEMFGASQTGNGAMLSENAGNQARLEYYLTDDRRKKSFNNTSDNNQWLSSVSTNSGTQSDNKNFNGVNADGGARNAAASYRQGVAPAFCVW
jgi:hypothetical protein